MTKQSWAAAVSALLFVITAAIIALSPVPFVTYGPGNTYNLFPQDDGAGIIRITGQRAYPVSGRVLMTTAEVTPVNGVVALPAGLYAWWSGAHEIMPEWAVYPAGASVSELETRDIEQMDTSVQDAAAAGLRAAGIRVDQLPEVLSVTDTGPAAGLLMAGDLILKVDGEETPTEVEVRKAINNRAIGDQVVFTVLRDRKEKQVRVSTTASKSQAGLPVVGVRFGLGYSYSPVVEINVDDRVGGPSGGLMMAVAVFDTVTSADLVGGRTIAGTGKIDGDGEVSEVGAVKGKIVAAQRDGAEIFLVPEGNCSEVPHAVGIRVVPVSSLSEALTALETLATPGKNDTVRSCP